VGVFVVPHWRKRSNKKKKGGTKGQEYGGNGVNDKNKGNQHLPFVFRGKTPTPNQLSVGNRTALGNVTPESGGGGRRGDRVTGKGKVENNT